MYKAPVGFFLCRYTSPCTASFAGGSLPSSLPLFYKSCHRACFMVLKLIYSQVQQVLEYSMRGAKRQGGKSLNAGAHQAEPQLLSRSSSHQQWRPHFPQLPVEFREEVRY